MLRANTQAVNVVGTFLKEMKKDQREMRRLICETLDVLSMREGGRHVTDTLRQMRLRLNTHFHLEEAFGYFEDTLAEQPWLGGAVQRLRDEHEGLSQQMDRIVCHAISAEESQEILQLRREFARFLGSLRRHESDENDLIMAAFNDEVGVGD